jgi:multidrug efflux pump subunit AcrB
MIRCDEEVAWMFHVGGENDLTDGGVEPIAERTDVVTGSDPTTSLPVTRSVAFDRPRAFTFQETLVYWQQDAVLWDELVLNLSLAGTGVFIVCVLALAHPAAAVAVAGVGVVDAFLFTTLVIGKLRFNVISVINFVMAVGLAVDYTLHFCHAFLAAPGLCRIERVQYTMRTMGSSILKGGGTTLLGTMPLAFSRSTIFRTFFALLFSTIVYGLAVGLILIPVVLSIAPLPNATHMHVEGVVPDLDQALDRVEALAESREEKKRGRSVAELTLSA